MKLKTNYLFVILILFIFCSCKKDKSSDTLITITGITETDEVANNIGNVDTTDWKFIDTWSIYEENLFRKSITSSKATERTRPNSSVVVIGYPNPAKTFIFFAFQLDSSMYFDTRIVDNNLKIKFQRDSINGGITMDNSIFSNNELYRIYYKIYSNGKVYRGHGDFIFLK